MSSLSLFTVDIHTFVKTNSGNRFIGRLYGPSYGSPYDGHDDLREPVLVINPFSSFLWRKGCYETI